MSPSLECCLVCDASTNLKKCLGCHTAHYCNEEHQKQDWKAHKAYCRKIAAAGTGNTFNAILFPVNESKPRLVKVPFKKVFDGDGEDYFHDLDTSIWFNGPGRSFVRTMPVEHSKVTGQHLGRRLGFKYDDNSVISGSPVNLCIQKLTKGKAERPWRGNILGLRLKHEETSEWFGSAIMKEDLELFVEFF